jgi:hypothetical protein
LENAKRPEETTGMMVMMGMTRMTEEEGGEGDAEGEGVEVVEGEDHHAVEDHRGDKSI